MQELLNHSVELTESLRARRPESKKERPLLQKYFDGLRAETPNKPDLDAVKPYFNIVDSRQHAFEEAIKLWDATYDSDKLQQFLTEAPNDEGYRYLKELRKSALITKNIARLVSENNPLLHEFNSFTTLLGKFNDRYYKENPRAKIARKIRSLPLAAFSMSKLSFGLSFVDNQTFGQKMESLLYYIVERLEKDLLPEKDFHGLRKDIRAFAHLLLVPASEEHNDQARWIFSKLDSLSTNFGRARNKLGKIEHKEFSPEGEPLLPIDPADRRKFTKVLPYLSKSLGIPLFAEASA